ncbi:MAG: RnfABCDGE type electron transport complex subunit D [Clostridia bacterium]|nr:RnfABCDGE type electron transport complex subunit D [Clostridia bacterium]
MMSLLSVSSSPHIRTSRTTASVMRDVLIALVPALLAGVLFFGWRSLAVVGVTVGFAIIICALVASLLGAAIFPVKDEEESCT